MALFPDVLKKAQAEIDAVVGNDRLPSFADRDHLPYTNALAKEVLRFNSVVPACKSIGTRTHAMCTDLSSQRSHTFRRKTTFKMVTSFPKAQR